MLNPFFLQGSSSEQGLIQDLINEQIRMYGVEVYYIPRKFITEKTVIKEVIQSIFDNAYPLEAYVNSYEGYGGTGTILSKFGIQDLDDLSLIISKERFETYISPLIKNLNSIKLSTRPKEGDLIYFPLGDRLFEIKYVEHEQPFYQLQKNYVYELRCELFRYEDEVVDTNIEEIDDNVQNQGYIQTLTVVGAAVTASAVSNIVNGGVRFIRVTNRGGGFNTAPKVAISSSPSGGYTAVGVATMIGNLIDCNGTSSLKVQGVEVVNSGYGYTVAPAIAFIGGGGSGVAATAVIGDGIVGFVTVTNGGSGYSASPTVTFSGPGIGTTAVGYAVVSSAGTVTQIRLRDAGIGYTVAPIITIAGPGSSGTGSFRYNEIVTGSTSGTTARVNSWDSNNNKLEVFIVSGSFSPGETITGSTSGASYKLRTLKSDNLVDPYSQNDVIEEEADKVIDFSESNPFGTLWFK